MYVFINELFDNKSYKNKKTFINCSYSATNKVFNNDHVMV